MKRSEQPEPVEDPRGELRTLQQRFVAANEQYDVVREASDSAVSRWVWATAPRYHLDPLHFYDREVSVGRIAASPPTDPRGWAAYGFSSKDRIVVEFLYLADLPGRRYETFYRETEDRILSYHFHHDRAQGCINCAQLIFTGGVYPGCYQQWAIRGWASRTYVTANGRIRSFAETFKQDDEPQRRLTGELRYDADGCVEVRIKWPGSRKADLSYRGAPPAENAFLRVGS